MVSGRYISVSLFFSLFYFPLSSFSFYLGYFYFVCVFFLLCLPVFISLEYLASALGFLIFFSFLFSLALSLFLSFLCCTMFIYLSVYRYLPLSLAYSQSWVRIQPLPPILSKWPEMSFSFYSYCEWQIFCVMNIPRN